MKDKSIHISVIKNQIKKLNKYLANGVDVDSKGEYNCTPLHYACQEGNIEIVKILLKNGADVNIQNRYSTFYPLFDAITSDNEDNYYPIIKLLIDAKADINSIDSFGNTILYYAIEKENIELIKLLISLGCDINRGSRYDKDSALHYAYFQKNEQIANLLIEAGADIKHLNLYNRRPISYL
jgi:ankyrin repeat protein